MDDLISRKAAIDTALTFLVEYCGAAFDEDMQKRMFERLNALPSAEPKRGKWDIEISADGYQATYRCSECGHQFKWLYDPHFPPVFNYCQKCGAYMRTDG